MPPIVLAPRVVFPYDAHVSAAANIVLDGATKQIAFKFFPPKTMEVVAVDLNLVRTGAPTGSQISCEIQTDSSDAPSGTALDDTIIGDTSPAATGWWGEHLMLVSTQLTINTPYWLVVKVSTVGAIDGANFFQARHASTSMAFAGERIRAFNGSDWTTVSAISTAGLFVLKDSTGAYHGFPLSAADANSSRTDIFGTNRQGMRFKTGSQIAVTGVQVKLGKAGSPNDLQAVLYEGTTQKGIATLPGGSILNNTYRVLMFPSPVLLAADTNIYIVLRQASDGGSDSADYDLRVMAINGSYIGAVLPADWRQISGTGDDPTALTVHTDEIPMIAPIISDPAVDLDQAAGGSETIITGFVVDTFTDTDGTLLDAHVGEMGATWTKHPSYATGEMVINDVNGARPNTDAPAYAAYFASGVPASADYDVFADVPVLSSGTGSYRLLARVDPSVNTMYQLIWTSTGNMSMGKLVAGSFTEIVAATAIPGGLSNGETYRMRFGLVGTTLKGYVDGVEVISVTDSSITAAGRVGISGEVTTPADATHHYFATFWAEGEAGGSGETTVKRRYLFAA